MWVPAGLFVLGLAAIIVEFFVPAAGLVGIAGSGAVIASIVLVFSRYGTTMGSVFLLAALVLVPVVMVLYFKLFPKTFFGKRLILGKAQDRAEGYVSYTADRYNDLSGKEGTTLSNLRPAGTVLIGRQRYSVVTGGEFIGKGEVVRVIKVEGNRILVRRGA